MERNNGEQLMEKGNIESRSADTFRMGTSRFIIVSKRI